MHKVAVCFKLIQLISLSASLHTVFLCGKLQTNCMVIDQPGLIFSFSEIYSNSMYATNELTVNEFIMYKGIVSISARICDIVIEK